MNNYPIQPQGELIGWCSSCNKLSYESDFDPATEDGQEWAECPFCGDFLITKHEEDCEKMIERIATLEAKLAALEWQPITADNLPKVGDEVGGVSDSAAFPWMCRAVTRGLEIERNANPQDQDWERLGYTHFRAINPPEAAHER